MTLRIYYGFKRNAISKTKTATQFERSSEFCLLIIYLEKHFVLLTFAIIYYCIGHMSLHNKVHFTCYSSEQENAINDIVLSVCVQRPKRTIFNDMTSFTFIKIGITIRSEMYASFVKCKIMFGLVKHLDDLNLLHETLNTTSF